MTQARHFQTGQAGSPPLARHQGQRDALAKITFAEQIDTITFPVNGDERLAAILAVLLFLQDLLS